MIIGKVVGSVVSTRKCGSLTGSKFMVIEPTGQEAGKRIVAVDRVGAGIGECVLVATGSAARVDSPTAPVDAAIVGILDNGQGLD